MGFSFFRSAITIAVAAALTPQAGWAQDPDPPDRECRCVDARGEEIEECVCVFRGNRWADDLGFLLGSAGRARLGVAVDVRQDAAYERDGVYLQTVEAGTPAFEAGLRAGDVITRIDRRSVLEPLPDVDESGFDADESPAVQRFLAIVRTLEPGEEIEVEYLRNGDARTATVTPDRARGWLALGGSNFSLPQGLALMDVEPFRSHMDENRLEELTGRVRGMERLGEGGDRLHMMFEDVDPCFSGHARGNLLFSRGGACVDGVRLQALNPQLAEYFGVADGVLVTEVMEESTLGLRAGDVIESIGDRPIDELSDVRRILGSYDEEENVTIGVVRRGEAMQVRGTRR